MENIFREKMTQAVKDTSLEAYSQLREYLGDKQIEVYKAIVEHPFSTRREISERENIPINTICGRVKELIHFGLVREGEKKFNELTGIPNYTIYAIANIDYNLLDIKKKESKESIRLRKKHLATIHKLIDFVESKVGKDLEILRMYGHEGTINALFDLKTDLELITTKQSNSNPFFYEDTGYSLLFKVNSDNREIFFDIEYNKLNHKLNCTCEDFRFRSNKCKHIKRVIKKFNLKVKENEK